MDDLPQSLGIADADWAHTPASVQVIVRALVRVIHDLQAQQQAQLTQIAALQQEVADLRARLAQYSGNSSKPPSSDPPSAPPRPPKTPRGRARGGQPGHPGQHRPDPLPDQVDEITDHHPTTCTQCAHPLTPTDATGVYQSRYVWEIPPIQPHVTEHRLHQAQCPDCQHVTSATAAGLPPGQFGARVIALLALLHGRFRLSDREIVALGLAVFGLAVCPATVVAAQQQTSGPPH